MRNSKLATLARISAPLLIALPYLLIGIFVTNQGYLSDAHAGFLSKAYLAADRGRLEVVGFSYPPLPLLLLMFTPSVYAPVVWGSLSVGLLAHSLIVDLLRGRRDRLIAVLLAVLLSPAVTLLVLNDFSQVIGLLLLWAAWKQYLRWEEERIAAHGFFAGLLFGLAVYATPVALPMAMLAALLIWPIQRQGFSSWVASALVLLFPVISSVLIWAYLAWIFTGSDAFLYEVFQNPASWRPSLVYPLTLLLTLAANRKRLPYLIVIALTLPLTSLFGFGYTAGFAFAFFLLMALSCMPANTNRLGLAVLVLIIAISGLRAWPGVVASLEPTKTMRAEKAIGARLARAPEMSILTDDRVSYRYVAWTGSARPYLLPADAGYRMALSAPDYFVDYILVCPGNSDLYRRFANQLPLDFQLRWRFNGCSFLAKNAAPRLF